MQEDVTKEQLARDKPKLKHLDMYRKTGVAEPFAPRKLDIACGQNKQEGFVGIDQSGDADITWDLFQFPWPIKDRCVREVVCAHFIEHIPHRMPGWEYDGFFMFFAEVWRICTKGAKITLTHPYVWNDRAFWDPTHVRYIHWMTYQYLIREFRKVNRLDHYTPDINFEVITAEAPLADDLMNRSQEYRDSVSNRQLNVWGDMYVVLKKAL